MTLIVKIISLNCGEIYEYRIDHRSYIHNLSSWVIKAWKKFRPEQDSIPVHDHCDTSAMIYQLSQLGAGHFVSA